MSPIMSTGKSFMEPDVRELGSSSSLISKGRKVITSGLVAELPSQIFSK